MAKFIETGAVAAQFLRPGDVTERRGHLYTIKSQANLSVEGLAIYGADTETGQPTVLRLAVGTFAPLYDREQ